MFNWIAHAYRVVTGAIDSTVQRWVHDLINGLYSFLHVIFGDVRKVWGYLWRDVGTFWQAIDHFGITVYRALNHLYRKWIPDIIHWIERDILAPLIRAWHWILHEGAIMWHYISHPALLVDYLWEHLIIKIEREAWNVADRLGRFAVALIWRNLNHFLILIEDVLDAIL